MVDQARSVKKLLFAGFWLLTAGLLFFNAWTGSQFPSDDCVYAVTAREALQDNGWLEPTWQRSPFLEKGPLLPWALAGSLSLLGETDLALRLPGILAALLFLACLYRLGRRLGLHPPAALVAVALAMALHVFFLTARRPMTDVPGMALGLAGFLLAAFPGSRGRGHGRAVAGGVLLGLSLLTKLTAPAPFLFGLLVLQASRPFRNTRGLLVTLGATAVTAIPWHAFMVAQHGQTFIDTYFLFHLLERASRAVVGDAAAQTYVAWALEREGLAAVLVAVSIPLTGVLALRRNRAALCICALGFGALAPLAISATALPHYLVTLVPAAALSVGLLAHGAGQDPAACWLPSSLAFLAALAFGLNNCREVLDPDHGPGARSACEALTFEGTAARLTAAFDLHDPCVAWYCGTRVHFLGADPGFLQATRDIPMLQGFVKAVEPGTIRELTRNGTLVLTRSDRLDSLGDLAQKEGVEITTREFGHRVVVEFTSGERSR